MSAVIFTVSSFFSIPTNYLTYFRSVVPLDWPTLGNSKEPPENPYAHVKFLNAYVTHLSHFLEGPHLKTELFGSVVLQCLPGHSVELSAQHGGSVPVCDWLAIHILEIRELGYKIQKRPPGIEESGKTTWKQAKPRTRE